MERIKEGNKLQERIVEMRNFLFEHEPKMRMYLEEFHKAEQETLEEDTDVDLFYSFIEVLNGIEDSILDTKPGSKIKDDLDYVGLNPEIIEIKHCFKEVIDEFKDKGIEDLLSYSPNLRSTRPAIANLLDSDVFNMSQSHANKIGEFIKRREFRHLKELETLYILVERVTKQYIENPNSIELDFVLSHYKRITRFLIINARIAVEPHFEDYEGIESEYLYERVYVYVMFMKMLVELNKKFLLFFAK